MPPTATLASTFTLGGAFTGSGHEVIVQVPGAGVYTVLADVNGDKRSRTSPSPCIRRQRWWPATSCCEMPRLLPGFCLRAKPDPEHGGGRSGVRLQRFTIPSAPSRLGHGSRR